MRSAQVRSTLRQRGANVIMPPPAPRPHPCPALTHRGYRNRSRRPIETFREGKKLVPSKSRKEVRRKDDAA